MLLRFLLIVIFLLNPLSRSNIWANDVINKAKSSILGVAISPANHPRSSSEDIEKFFYLAADMGGHVSLIIQWSDQSLTIDILKSLISQARQKGLKFDLELSPTKLTNGRKDPDVPYQLGIPSFKNKKVRQAFKTKALQLASLKPDYLGLGTEINLLAQNPDEYRNYVTLIGETYQIVKRKYPKQQISVTFQWDIMLTQKLFGPLEHFKGKVDVFGFTTYPSFFVDPSRIPADYYSSIRKLLPDQKIAFTEVGWNSKSGSNEGLQSEFYRKLPELMTPAKPVLVTIALLHDVVTFQGELNILNSVGVRHHDGKPKPSWNIVRRLIFK